jgi:uncharacterized protein YcbK (DUF882 family)
LHDCAQSASARARYATTARGLCGLLAFVFCLVAGTQGTQDAIANGDTRTISLHHMHTKELTTVTFKRDGRYDAAALEKLNWALRDWRLDEPTKMDPRLFDVAWEVHRSVGSSEPFHVVSAYRSPATNSMLRNRSRGVAKHSQHMNGKAMDFFLPDVSPHQVREVGMRLQRGGVGYYPTAYTPFIHLDVGSVRSWPRMSRDQLVRLFPDGRTVHLPSNGGAMDGYEIAKAEIIARGGSVAGSGLADLDEGAIIQSSRRSLWASLFGGDEEEEARPTRGRRAVLASRSAPSDSLLAYASGNSEDGGTRPGFAPPVVTQTDVAASLPRERSTRSRPGGTTTTQLASLPPLPSVPEPKIEREQSDNVAKLGLPAADAPAARLTPVLAPAPFARPRGLSIETPASREESTVLASLAATAAEQAGPAKTAALRLIDSPLPPSRPSSLIATESVASAPPGLPGAASGIPSKVSSEPRLIALTHPLPPGRPPVEGPAVAAPVVTASLGPIANALTGRPQSPAPTNATSSSDTSVRLKNEPRPVIDERTALRQLFEATALQPVAASPFPVRVATAKARITRDEAGGWSSAAAPAAAAGFSATEPSDVRTDRFSGPAVRPLPPTFVKP